MMCSNFIRRFTQIYADFLWVGFDINNYFVGS